MPGINSPTPDATTTNKGKIQLAGVLAGTASAPSFSTTSGTWASWTPTITSGSGTITTSSGSGRYYQIGKTVHYKATLTITSNGTGGGWVNFTFPVAANTTNNYAGSGRANLLSGKMLQCRLISSTICSVYDYANAYPAASGEALEIAGTYEAA